MATSAGSSGAADVPQRLFAPGAAASSQTPIRLWSLLAVKDTPSSQTSGSETSASFRAIMELASVKVLLRVNPAGALPGGVLHDGRVDDAERAAAEVDRTAVGFGGVARERRVGDGQRAAVIVDPAAVAARPSCPRGSSR